MSRVGCRFGEEYDYGTNQCKPMKEIPMELIKAKNKAEGGHFFDKDAMRFFNSRIEVKKAKVKGRKAFFVTSERFNETYPKKYTIHMMNLDTGRTDAQGEFQKYKSREEALSDLKEITG